MQSLEVDGRIDQVIMEWSYLPICRHLNFGFSKRQMAQFFLSIPSNIAKEFKRLLQAVHDSHLERIKRLQRFQTCSANIVPVDDDNDVENNLWKEQTTCGYLKINYHPASQERLNFDFNEKLAKQVAMDSQDLAIAFAHHRIPVLFSAVDFFSLLVDDARQSLKCIKDRFLICFRCNRHAISIFSLPQISSDFEV